MSPELAWEKYRDNPKELKKREHLWVTSAVYAYSYALHVLEEPFPLGEKAIASHPDYAYYYACNVLKKPSPLGEAAIASHPEIAYDYAHDVLEKNSRELTLFLLKCENGLVK